MQMNQMPYQGQADAEAVMQGIGRTFALCEKIENIRKHVARDPGSIVDHAENYIIVLLIRRERLLRLRECTSRRCLASCLELSDAAWIGLYPQWPRRC